MALWGNTDTANDAPKYLTSGAGWPNDADQAFFIDTTEAAVTANRAQGLKTGGWNAYTSYTDANGATRHRVEPLVAMAVSAGDAGDLGVTGNTAVEDATVADSD